jgi:hypothetical protein
MKKIVLTFGLISGVVSSVLMLSTALLLDRIGFDKGVIVGYTGIVLSFLLVFFRIRSYRENVGGGQISDNPLINAAVTFMEPFPIGLIISLISAAILRRRKPDSDEQLVGERLASS